MSNSGGGKGGSAPFGSAMRQPQGNRPPPYAWSLIVARLLLLVCLILISARAPLLHWADAQPALPATSTMPGTLPTPGVPPAPAVPPDVRLRVMGARVVYVVLRPPTVNLLWAASLLGLGALALELTLAAALLVVQTLTLWRLGGTYLRIRTPQSATPRSSGQHRSAGEDLFRAAHDMLPISGMLSGRAPWLTFVLLGRPDEPTEFGAFVGGERGQRAVWAGALRKIILGQVPDAIVDDYPISQAGPGKGAADPLAQALAVGRVVLWRDFGLSAPPSYPLRFHDDVERSDLLGPLAAALQPRTGVVQTEAQLILRPRKDWELQRGWRASGMRRLLRFKAKQHYALTDDAKVLEEKLDGPVYDTVLRLLVIAEDRTQQAAARAELQEAAAVIGQYAARSGSRVQRFRPIGGGRVVVPPDSRAAWGQLITLVMGVLVALGGLVLLPSLPTAPFQAWAGRWPLLTLPPAVLARIPQALSTLVPVFAGLLALWITRRYRNVPGTIAAERLRARVPRAMPPANGLLPFRAWRGPAILAPGELSGLWHLPTPALGALVRWLPNRFLPAPPHAFVPPQPPPEQHWIVVGHGYHADGTRGPIGQTMLDLCNGMHFSAGMGAGKSRAEVNFAVQFARNGGYTEFDGKGDASDNLVTATRERLNLEDERRLVLIDVLDADWPIGINTLASVDLTQPGGKDLLFGQVEAIFARLDPETWGHAPGMKDYLRMATLLVVEGEAHPTLPHVAQAIQDDAYRARLLEMTRNQEVRTFWEITYPRQGEQQKTSRDALLRRFNMLLVPELTRYIVAQARPRFSFEQAISEGLIVLVPVPHVTLGGLAGAIAMIQFQAFVAAAFKRPGKARQRPPYGLLVDELQVLVANSDPGDVQRAISQLRGLDISAVYTTQALTQIGTLKDELLINLGNRLILQTREPDAGVYAQQYSASGLTAHDISGQDPSEHQYFVGRCADRGAGPLSIQPLPWPEMTDIVVPPYEGPDWRTVLPEDSATPEFDVAVRDLIYADHPDSEGLAQILAESTEAQWAALEERWQAIARCQRDYILAHPGSIPLPERPPNFDALTPEAQLRDERERRDQQRKERQRWLSRLGWAQPRLLAMTSYARIRRAIAPEMVVERPERGGMSRSRSTPGSGRAASPVPMTNFAVTDQRKELPAQRPDFDDDRGFVE